MKKNFYVLLSLTLLVFSFTVTSLHAQCLDWVEPTDSTGWTDFNNPLLFAAPGAPCDADGMGCPFNEITAFEVFASEAYSIVDFAQGGQYSFSICNGDGAGSWVPEFTIISPSGVVDAFGAGDGDSCTISWTASESGTYTIVINEAGQCGGGPNTGVGNGFPAITCLAGTACFAAPCSAGTLTTTGTVSICDAGGTFDLAVSMDTIPDGGDFIWNFSDQLGGTGGAPGGFNVLGFTTTETFDNDLNGLLSSNMAPVLAGPWVIFGVTRDAAGAICDVTTDSLIVFFGTESPTISDIQDIGSGSASVLAAGGVAPYTYLWSDANAQTTEEATNLDPGDYTVTVTDANGCTVEGMITVISTAIENVEALDELLIAPNPSSGQFSVQMQLSSNEQVKIYVMDLTGKTLQSIERTTSGDRFEFNMNEAAAGVYFVKIAVGNDYLTRRIVITE